MAGRITKSEQQLKPDPKFGDKVLAKFINCIMKDGKKAVAQRVVYDALLLPLLLLRGLPHRDGESTRCKRCPTCAVRRWLR